MSGPNADLFVEVLAQIEKHPETWSQGSFGSECDTAFCFAGHTERISGLRVNQGDGGKVAAELLGIEWRDPFTSDAWQTPWANGAPLFHAENTLDDLYRISADLLGVDETVLREKVAAVVADGAVQS